MAQVGQNEYVMLYIYIHGKWKKKLYLVIVHFMIVPNRV
jgi:hypothetical protein